MLNESTPPSHLESASLRPGSVPAFSNYHNEKVGQIKREEQSIGELALHSLCKKVLEGRRLLIASNRGPVTYERDAQGQLVAKRGSGGVVTALSSLTNYTPVTWVAAALSDTDRQLAA